MSKQPTAIRRMWYHYGAASVTSNSEAQLRDIGGGKLIRQVPRPVIVIWDNPAARLAMIDRVCKTNAGAVPINREMAEFILATALTPAKRRKG